MLKFLPYEKNTKAFCKCVERLETLSKYPYYMYTSHPEIILGCFSMYNVAALGHPPSQIIQLRYILVVFCHAQLMLLRSFAKFLLHTHNGVVLCDKVIWKGVLQIYLTQEKKYCWKLIRFSFTRTIRALLCNMIWEYICSWF